MELFEYDFLSVCVCLYIYICIQSIDGECGIGLAGPETPELPSRAELRVGSYLVPEDLDADRLRSHAETKLGVHSNGAAAEWDAMRITVSNQDQHHALVAFDASGRISARYPVISAKQLDSLVVALGLTTSQTASAS